MSPRQPTRAAALALLALPLALGLVACGGDDDDTEETGSSTSSTEADAAAETETEDGAASTDEDAAGAAVVTVFDSALPYDDKLALVEGGEAHRADHDGYVAAAEAVGGIAVEPTDVAVDGDVATVTYRVLFGGNEAYADLTMEVTRVDGEWIVPTTTFCDFLSSARTPCATAG